MPLFNYCREETENEAAPHCQAVAPKTGLSRTPSLRVSFRTAPFVVMLKNQGICRTGQRIAMHTARPAAELRSFLGTTLETQSILGNERDIHATGPIDRWLEDFSFETSSAN